MKYLLSEMQFNMDVGLVRVVFWICILAGTDYLQAQTNQPFEDRLLEESIWGGDLERRDYAFQVEPFGAEEVADADNKPRIPEPMVFDLVRPLGAKKGEAEINTLAVIPWNTSTHPIDWAPEVEIALADGLAFEFELPFEESTLLSYKFAVQKTFGTAFDERFIHGTQAILVCDRHTGHLTPTLLYIAGVEFDPRWSALVMMGLRTEIDGVDKPNRTQRLFNFSLFRHIGSHTTLGMETNHAVSMAGKSEARVMPQLHHELGDRVMVQIGSGILWKGTETIPESAVRIIYSY